MKQQETFFVISIIVVFILSIMVSMDSMVVSGIPRLFTNFILIFFVVEVVKIGGVLCEREDISSKSEEEEEENLEEDSDDEDDQEITITMKED